jgi:uncharacterized protein YgbK (DUF1537 family)
VTCQVLLSADDRTGALEIGGLVADQQHPVPVGPSVSSPRCCVVDIGTRHLSPYEARTRMVELLRRNAAHRAHKMDAGLRGNWPYEIEVLLEAGHRVAVVCAFPDANRRCRGGVVYIHGLPVLESVFGTDPLNAPVSSRPAEVLEHAGVRGDVVVWDADDNAQMHQAIARAHRENRILVGASGVLGAFARELLGAGPAQNIDLPRPRLVLCGSLNPLSRQQLEQTGLPIVTIGENLAPTDSTLVLATPEPQGEISSESALDMANRVTSAIRPLWSEIGTLIVIGGDTASALVGDDDLACLGTVAPGIPASQYRNLCLVTKGGGIGQPDTLKELLARPDRAGSQP